MKLQKLFDKLFLPKLDRGFSESFKKEITKVNYQRTKYLSILLLGLDMVGLGLDYYMYVNNRLSHLILYAHISLAIFLVVIFFVANQRLKVIKQTRTCFINMPLIAALISLLHTMIIALQTYKTGDAPSLYFLGICGALIAFYWTFYEAVLLYFIGNVVFMVALYLFFSDKDSMVLQIVNSFVFRTLFLTLSRMFFNLKVSEFKNFKEVKEQSKLLQDKNFELDQFVYKTSHDLRAPLTSILGLTNLIELEKDEKEVRKQVLMIKERALRLDEFIKSLLNYSRASNSPKTTVHISFKTLVSQSIEDLQYFKNFNKVKIYQEIDEESPFFSDKIRLSIVLKNITSNAIKYQNENIKDRFLRVKVKTTPEKAVIRISDNGIGIREELLKNVFDMFYRAHEQYEGSGLGLYIVKQTIERLGGSIKVTSKFGSGTSFIIELPNEINFQ